MAEAELNKLRRMADNRRCGTCRHEDRLGFNAVCVKFQIFVCGDCKSAHQAFSHRCKSVTMSNWNKTEVDALRQDNGGGNAVNQATFFAMLDDQDRVWPTKGCHPNDLKDFVRIAYEERRWFSDRPAAASAPAALAAAPACAAPGFSPSSAPVSIPHGMDLLGAMEPFASAPAARPPAEQPTPFAADFGKGFVDAGDNGGFSASDAASDAGTDAWSAFGSAPAAPPALDWAAFSSAPVTAPPKAAAPPPATDWTSFSAATPAAAPLAAPPVTFGGGFDDFVGAPPPVRKFMTAPASSACTAAALDGLSALSLASMNSMGGGRPSPGNHALPMPVAPPSLAAAKGGIGSSSPAGMAAAANGVGLPAGAIGLPMRPPPAPPPMPPMGMNGMGMGGMGMNGMGVNSMGVNGMGVNGMGMNGMGMNGMGMGGMGVNGMGVNGMGMGGMGMGGMGMGGMGMGAGMHGGMQPMHRTGSYQGGMGGGVMAGVGMGGGLPMVPPVQHGASSPAAMLLPSRAPAGKADILSMYSSGGTQHSGGMAAPQMRF